MSSDYGDFCKEQRKRKQRALHQRVDCGWANFKHKTWPNEICIRCNEPVDEKGMPVRQEVKINGINFEIIK